MNIKVVFNLLKEASQDWSRDRASMLAAALAYYTIFSLAPMLIISVALASAVLGEDVNDNLVGLVERNVSLEAAQIVNGLINSANNATSGITATIISVILALIGATGVFAQLKRALNTVWGVIVNPELGIMAEIRTRMLSFLMVLIIGVLLILSFFVSTAVTALSRYLGAILPGIGQFLPIADLFVSFIMSTLLFAILFKVLPDVEIAWRDVWLGAIVTALFFNLGKYLIALYLSNIEVGVAYGAASSLIILLVWVYYSAWIFLFGAEFTQVFANKYGSKILPAENAVWLRIQQYEEMAPVMKHKPVPQTQTATPLQRQLEKQVAFMLLGLAAGLLIAFIGSLKRV